MSIINTESDEQTMSSNSSSRSKVSDENVRIDSTERRRSISIINTEYDEKPMSVSKDVSSSKKGKKRSRSDDENVRIAYTLGFAAATHNQHNQHHDLIKPSSPSRRVKKRMRMEDKEKIVNLLPTETRLRARLKELDKLPKHSRYAIQRRKMLTRALELVQSCKDEKDKSPPEELLKLLSELSI